MDAVTYGYMAASNEAQTMTHTVKRTPGIITLGDNELVIKPQHVTVTSSVLFRLNRRGG